MAIAFQPEWNESERVVDAAMIGYGALGTAARPVALSAIVDRSIDISVGGLLCAVVMQSRSVEIVLDSMVNQMVLREAIDSLAYRDWSVTVLVPIDAVGDAHAALRGALCNLQPWWDEDGEIMFGGYELP